MLGSNIRTKRCVARAIFRNFLKLEKYLNMNFFIFHLDNILIYLYDFLSRGWSCNNPDLGFRDFKMFRQNTDDGLVCFAVNRKFPH